jgi:hypothetical protein
LSSALRPIPLKRARPRLSFFPSTFRGEGIVSKSDEGRLLKQRVRVPWSWVLDGRTSPFGPIDQGVSFGLKPQLGRAMLSPSARFLETGTTQACDLTCGQIAGRALSSALRPVSLEWARPRLGHQLVVGDRDWRCCRHRSIPLEWARPRFSFFPPPLGGEGIVSKSDEGRLLKQRVRVSWPGYFRNDPSMTDTY